MIRFEEAIRCVDLNPVGPGLVARADQWEWSRARAHADGASGSPLLDPARPFGGTRPDPRTGWPLAWTEWLALGEPEGQYDRIRRATLIGRPCGDEIFIKKLETQAGRSLTPKKRGRKPFKVASEGQDQQELF